MSLENVKHIILVLSGKGGVGKSSVTTQLALSLSLAGQNVGILDIDLTGPSIPRLLGLENEKITQAPGGWLPCEVHKSQILPPISKSQKPDGERTETSSDAAAQPAPILNSTNGPTSNLNNDQKIGSLHAISLGLLLPSRSSAVVWRGPKKTAMVRQFLTSVLWPPSTDYLLIDTPPGTSDEHISLAESLLQNVISSQNPNHNQLAGAVIVTTPQAVSISDVKKEINFCKKTGIQVLGVVENMSGYVCECCGEGTNLFGKGGGEVMAGECGVRFLGRVAVDIKWGRLVEEGVRPGYGRTGGSGDEGEEEDGKREGREIGGGQVDGEGRDDALLVDKYRSCSLCGVFEGITKDLMETVEGKTV